MGALKKFFDNAGSVGIGYAFDCAVADAEFKTSVAVFKAQSKRLAKKLPKDVDYISEKKTRPGDKTTAKKNACDEQEPFEDDEFDDDDNIVDEEELEDDEILEKSIPEDSLDKDFLPAVIKEEDDDDIVDLTGAMNQNDILENIDDATETLSDIDAREVKLTILSLLYISCIIRAEQVYKEIDIHKKSSEKDIVFINSVCNALTDMSFNFKIDTDLLENQVSSLKNFVRICRYEARYNKSCPELLGCLEKAKEYVKGGKKTAEEVFEAATEEADNETTTNSVVSPVQFMSNTPDPAPKITKKEVSMLEQLFGDTLLDKRYEFYRVGSLYSIMTFDRNGMPINYNIDPGFIFGSGVCMLVIIYGNMFPINIAGNRSIIRKFLDNYLTIPSQKEMTEITKNLMVDFRIYVNIDMSRGNDILPKLNKRQYDTLQSKLSKIMSLSWGENNIPEIPRFRFKSFKSVDQFTLVSDDKVKIPPLPGFNFTINPMELLVKGDEVYVTIGDRQIYADLSKFKPQQPQQQAV